jgi:AcrR family transcriptional regulator
MSRRKPDLRLASVLSLAAMGPPSDDVSVAILDAAEGLMRRFGLHRWSMDDVAGAANLGRTTVYRSFANRDDLVHAVLARELRSTLEQIGEATARHDRLDDKFVAAVLAALDALRGSAVERLLETDPTTVLPFLTTEAAPLLAIARTALAAQIRAVDPAVDSDLAELVGEAAARFGLSFVLTRATVVPVDDPAAAADLLGKVVRPLLAALGRAG